MAGSRDLQTHVDPAVFLSTCPLRHPSTLSLRITVAMTVITRCLLHVTSPGRVFIQQEFTENLLFLKQWPRASQLGEAGVQTDSYSAGCWVLGAQSV